MNTTRRGWLTAFSSLIALPALPKIAAEPSKHRPEPPTLADLLARQTYSANSSPIPWDEESRIPLTQREIRCREELLRDNIHYLQTTGAQATDHQIHQQELRELSLARKLLELLPTGHPITFRYNGGSSPGTDRTVLPTLVFHHPDPSVLPGMNEKSFHESRRLYLQAYCLERLAPRTFRLDRIHTPSLMART